MTEHSECTSSVSTSWVIQELLRLPDPSATRTELRAGGLVAVLPAAASKAARSALLAERAALLKRQRRRDLWMPQSRTARRMSVIGGLATSSSSMLTALYTDPDLLAWGSAVFDFELEVCPSPIEHMIFTTLDRIGDTHGWHTDDYPVAMIVLLKGPADLGSGGTLEIERDGEVATLPLTSGDAYILRSDLVRHRVSPLNTHSQRIILNLTYTRRGYRPVENGSATLLCD